MLDGGSKTGSAPKYDDALEALGGSIAALIDAVKVKRRADVAFRAEERRCYARGLPEAVVDAREKAHADAEGAARRMLESLEIAREHAQIGAEDAALEVMHAIERAFDAYEREDAPLHSRSPR